MGRRSPCAASRPADGPSAGPTAVGVGPTATATAASATTTRAVATAARGARSLGFAPPYAGRWPRVSRASTRGPSRWQWGCLAMLSRDRLKYVLSYFCFPPSGEFTCPAAERRPLSYASISATCLLSSTYSFLSSLSSCSSFFDSRNAHFSPLTLPPLSLGSASGTTLGVASILVGTHFAILLQVRAIESHS